MSEMSEISDREDEVEEPQVDASYFSDLKSRFYCDVIRTSTKLSMSAAPKISRRNIEFRMMPMRRYQDFNQTEYECSSKNIPSKY
ncbi:hypothetical protein QE152_g10212 [Popillia japonica]|uniref:Uncharacterized protein n=1 Tax=Popillia japonica TaxID=7064 RepID=A0AAW1LVU6_POPJA